MSRSFSKWIIALEEDVIQAEYGYEPGEFTVFPEHWRPLFKEGLTPKEAFDRALAAHETPHATTDREAERPVRVQLRRTKGWKMPANTVKVDRSTRWGNPFPIALEGPLGRVAPDAEGATGFFRAMLDDPELRRAAGYPDDLSPLRGKNLACWCPLDAPHCHADVLLELANGAESGS